MGGFELGQDDAGALGKLLVACRRAVRVAPLGAGVVDRVRLFLGTFWLLATAQTGCRGRDRFVITLRDGGRVVLSDYSHLHLLELIFVERNYDVEPLSSPKVIVDLGSNIGLSVVFFASKYPGARVLGVEPDPGAFELLRRNAGRLGGVTVRHAAVGD